MRYSTHLFQRGARQLNLRILSRSLTLWMFIGQPFMSETNPKSIKFKVSLLKI